MHRFLFSAVGINLAFFLLVSGLVLVQQPVLKMLLGLASFLCAGVNLAMVWHLDRHRSQAVQKAAQAAKRASRAREALREVTEDARKAMAVKDEFLANMSHEIRNPMNGILGMMHMLLDTNLDREQRKFADIVQNSARALLVIVNDILDLSKIEAGKLELDIRPFDLEIGIKDMVSLPELQARQKGLEFSYAIDPSVPRRLNGDIGRIRQVILNLIGNAVKFTETGSVSLTISLNHDTETLAGLHFAVADSGIGIRDDKMAHVFGSFNQADISTTKKYGGTGLGLAICKLLVEKMGGKIGADSVEMKGSTFWFDIELEKSRANEASIDFFNISLSDVKLLAVSDSAGIGKELRTNLSRLALDYEHAPRAADAVGMMTLSAREHTPFHVVIMEVHESGRYAEKLARQILTAKTFPEPKLILLTGVGRKGDARRYEALGFSAFLGKPVAARILADCIRAVLCLPFSDGESRWPIITRFSIEESKKQTFRILVVEDMETNLMTAKALIAKQGFVTDEARNGRQAVEKQTQTPCDLILMDCQMPVMDGYEATRRIRAYEAANQLERVPIIAMTGNAFERDRQKCIDAGMDDFIFKPVEPGLLERKLKRHLRDASAVALSPSLPDENKVPEKMKGKDDGDTRLNDADRELLDFLDDLPVAREPLSVPGQKDQRLPDIRFNKDRLYKRFGNDEELVSMILHSFFKEAPDLISGLETAIAKADTEGVRTSAHALKGSSANVNADRLSGIALELEQSARSGDIRNARKMYERIYEEFRLFAVEAKQ